jgi:hypothetical protein
MAKKTAKSKKDDKPETTTAFADNNANAEVITGEIVPAQSITEQAKEARGEEEAKKDDGGAVDTSAADANYTDEEKAKDAAKDAKVKHLESLGLDPEAASQPGTGGFKVEDADPDEPMYVGVVTVEGVDGQYYKKISTRIDVGPTPKGHDWLEYAFKVHFPSADISKGITVDPENKTDPLLRTQHG